MRLLPTLLEIVYIVMMIDESSLRVRFDALRPSLDERRRRLSAAAEAKAAGYGGIAAVARDEGRPEHDWARSEGLAEPRLLDGRGAAQGRGHSSVDGQGPDAVGGLATIARAGDDG